MQNKKICVTMLLTIVWRTLVDMAMIDIICGAILLIFAIFGLFKGFARQVLNFFSGFIAIVGAFFLLKPVFNLLSGFDFFGNLVTTISGLFKNLTFLDSYASAFGKTTATLLTDYLVMLIVYVVLAIALGLVWKLVKIIIEPISDLPFIKVFDRILGLALGIFWGALLAFGLIYLWAFLKDISFISNSVPQIGEFYDSIVLADSYVKTYVVGSFDKITEFIMSIWNLLLEGVSKVA